MTKILSGLFLSAFIACNSLASTSLLQPAPNPKPPQEVPTQQPPAPTLIQVTQQIVPPDMACILNAGVLKVAIYDGNTPPFYFTNKKGEFVGIDVNIATLLAKELGVKVEFMKAPSFDAVVELVKQGKAHVAISKLSVTLERAKTVHYTGRYVHMGKALLMNRVQLEKLGGSRDATLEKVFANPDAKIAVIANSSFEKFAQRIFPHTKIVPYKTWDEVTDAVMKGEVLAAFRDEWEIRKFIDDRADAPIKAQAVIIKGEVDPIEMIVGWNSNHLAHFIEKFVEINNLDFNVTKLFNEYKEYQKNNN